MLIKPPLGRRSYSSYPTLRLDRYMFTPYREWELLNPLRVAEKATYLSFLTGRDYRRTIWAVGEADNFAHKLKMTFRPNDHPRLA